MRQITNQTIDVTQIVINFFVGEQFAFFFRGQRLGFLFVEQFVDAFLHRDGSAKDHDALFEFEVNRTIAQ